MFDVRLDVIELKSPSDCSGLSEVLQRIDPARVVAVLGKTEGSGLGKDTGREETDHMIRRVLRDHDATSDSGRPFTTVLSGGCPGVITPHLAVLSRRPVDERQPVVAGAGHHKRLTVGTARSAVIEAHEVGRPDHVGKVAIAVTEAIAHARIFAPNDVHAVFVKAPTLSSDSIDRANTAGLTTVTDDLGIGPNGAICWSNDASALGVAVALGEVERSKVSAAAIRSDFSMYSDVAITSAAGEKSFAEVVVLGNTVESVSDFRVGHSPMIDVLDIEAVDRALIDACGDGSGSRDARRRAHYVMGKMIIPGENVIRGHRITWQDDPMAFHVAKAMGGYAFAAVTGMTCSFVSGGEANSHQGPPGGNPVAAVVRCS